MIRGDEAVEPSILLPRQKRTAAFSAARFFAAVTYAGAILHPRP